MSLLHQNTSQDTDDAARGEEFTKGTSHIVVAAIVAAVLVTVGIAAFVWMGQKPPAAAGEVSNVRVHLRHVESSGVDANGEAMAKESFDQVLVFAHVKLHNQSKDPLFLHEAMANVTLPDGIHSSYAATASDYNRLFIAFPDLAGFQGTPLPAEATLEPGASLEGEVVFTYQMTRPQWAPHKDMDFSFAFRYQPRLVLKAAGEVEM